MEYDVLFDVADQAPAVGVVAIGLVFIAIGAVLWKYRRSPALRERTPYAPLIAGLFLGFSVLWTTGASAVVFGQHFRMRYAIGSDRVAIVEGPVERFHPMPPGGRDMESFWVRGVFFSYSDYVSTGGFNQTRAHGGPIREGLHVRIHYLNEGDRNVILRLAARR